MRYQIRPGTFETASSAIHSLIISENGMEPSKLKANKTTGKVMVPLTYLDREHKIYSTQLEKLTFLCTLLWCICESNGYTVYDHIGLNDINDDYRFHYINDAVKDYCGLEIQVKIPKIKKGLENIGADHQIYNDVAYSGELPYVNIYNERSIQEFIFNSYIAVETGSD